MTTLTYAGIGSRATPPDVLRDMRIMAGWLARTGWHLASGGADGADTAFAGGAPAGQRTLYPPWPGYNGHGGPDCVLLDGPELAACTKVAAGLHPAWHRCSPGARRLHARNSAILLGPGSTGPSMRWSPGRAVRRSRGARASGSASPPSTRFRC